MREIKFRGKRVDNGECVVGSLIVLADKSLIATPTDTNNFTTYVSAIVNTETVGQYTGLKTDTGKEVYEGDIIVIPNLIGKIHNHIDVVVFENGTFHLERASNILVCQELLDDGVSVIGNIYENPDLLEQ